MVLPVSVFTKICMVVRVDGENYRVVREVEGFQQLVGVCQRCGAYKPDSDSARVRL